MKESSGTISELEKSRNTPQQLSWYEEFQQFANGSPWRAFDAANNFPVLATRQAVTRFLETYEFYKLVQNVPGSFIELGVASGSFLMALAHFCAIFEAHHYTRKIVGFDTFEGFTEPAPQDKTSGAQHMKKGGMAWDTEQLLNSAISFYDRNRMIGNIPKVELVRGDVSQTLPQYLERHPELIVGMLHLDVDLYEPSRDAIKLLRSRMPRGSLIVFDEPNHPDYPGETLAMAETFGIDNLRLRRSSLSSMAAYAFVE